MNFFALFVIIMIITTVLVFAFVKEDDDENTGNAPQTRKIAPAKMSTIRIVAWGVTVLFALIFLVKWIYLFSIETPNGSLGFATPYILGIFMGNAIIPGALWLIVYFQEKKKKD